MNTFTLGLLVIIEGKIRGILDIDKTLIIVDDDILVNTYKIFSTFCVHPFVS